MFIQVKVTLQHILIRIYHGERWCAALAVNPRSTNWVGGGGHSLLEFPGLCEGGDHLAVLPPTAAGDSSSVNNYYYTTIVH